MLEVRILSGTRLADDEHVGEQLVKYAVSGAAVLSASANVPTLQENHGAFFVCSPRKHGSPHRMGLWRSW
jgi:hypothetical protein